MDRDIERRESGGMRKKVCGSVGTCVSEQREKEKENRGKGGEGRVCMIK